jgi:signal peptidase II
MLVRLSVPFGESREVVPGLFAIKHTRNTGAAGGLFASNPRTLRLFSILAVLSKVHTFFDMRRRMRDNKSAWLAFAMYAGGGASNLLERFTRGYVTDYLQVCPDENSPVFNMADVCIFKGSLGLLWAQTKLLSLSVAEAKAKRRSRLQED